MSDLHHKMPRSRSRSVRQTGQENVIKLSRRKPVFVPKSIRFIRGPMPSSHQFVMDDNVWVSMPEKLSQLMVQEHVLIIEQKASHTFPPTPSTSIGAFFSAFELEYCEPDDPMKTELVKAFTDSMRSLFQKHLLSSLLYEPEHTIDTIKTDMLQNTPAIFVLRFLYFLPSLLKYDDPNSEVAQPIQNGIKMLLEFAENHGNSFFVMPSVFHRPSASAPAQKTASKSHGHKDRNY